MERVRNAQVLADKRGRRIGPSLSFEALEEYNSKIEGILRELQNKVCEHLGGAFLKGEQ